MNLKLTNIDPDDMILAIRCAKSFVKEGKPVGIRHGTVYGYFDPITMFTNKSFYVYRVKTGIVVRYSKSM